MDTLTQKQGLGIGIIIIVVTVMLASPFLLIPNPTGVEGVQVALYFDRGCDATCRDALESMFRWMGAEVTIVGGSEIGEGVLTDYDILALPSGCWCTERCEILGEEMDYIRQFVEDGGSYFGIDRGASYATNFRLGIFNGTYFPDLHGADTFLMEMNVNKSSTGPDLSDGPDSYTILYDASGYFMADDMSEMIPLVTFPDSGLPCMLVYKYGTGNVFLSSVHPEYEEGDGRDGTDIYDLLDDPDSEWPLMLKICKWLIEDSQT
ncbi:MAG: hypothetical protein ACFFC0_05140 [Promethearchaeota archaeon]